MPDQALTPVQVIGIGLDGAAGLTEAMRHRIEQATLLVGSARHLSYFPDHPAEKLVLSNFRTAIDKIRALVTASSNVSSNVSSNLTPNAAPLSAPSIVVLASGDPLFFGFGRLLLAELPADWLTFHPHLSAVQLAFSRIKLPWQDAQLISAHGRSLDELTKALQQGAEKVAVLTDGTNTPAEIARLVLSLDIPTQYQIWVCENLGGPAERVQSFTPESLIMHGFDPLNVVVLLRLQDSVRQPLNLQSLPLLGIADPHFLSFTDRPRLMTKREIRILALGELALQPQQVVWDIGAGTGSVAIEMARLCPTNQIYAIEQTAAGLSLIQQNCQRFQVENVTPIHGTAPEALGNLPAPDRIFIGGSGGKLASILDCCSQRLRPQGLMVLALATLEHLTQAIQWLDAQPSWQHQLLQIQLARSVPVANLTRFSPLNPITLLTICRDSQSSVH
jgi:precorrin-6Y C5,15-methyltransferase (decarboxylating)